MCRPPSRRVDVARPNTAIAAAETLNATDGKDAISRRASLRRIVDACADMVMINPLHAYVPLAGAGVVG